MGHVDTVHVLRNHPTQPYRYAGLDYIPSILCPSTAIPPKLLPIGIPLSENLHEGAGWAIASCRWLFWEPLCGWLLCDLNSISALWDYASFVHILDWWSRKFFAYNFTAFDRPVYIMMGVNALPRFSHEPLMDPYFPFEFNSNSLPSHIETSGQSIYVIRSLYSPRLQSTALLSSLLL